MEIVTSRLSNPFGMRPPCPRPCSDGVPAVFGFGDPNADFHVIGDHPGAHGGRSSGIPFTDHPDAERLLACLEAVGILECADGHPSGGSVFMSYLHMCCPPDGETPDEGAYTELESFFDAELRAVAAHVLIPVGDRAIKHVLEYFTAIPVDRHPPGTLHAMDLAGRGFLVLPARDPASWSDADEDAFVETLTAIVSSDYHQEADLTRFFHTNEQYLVR